MGGSTEAGEGDSSNNGTGCWVNCSNQLSKMSDRFSLRSPRSPLCALCGLLLLLSLPTCGPPNRQDVDLSQAAVTSPEDGIGHYVYAFNAPETVRPGGQLDIQMEWRTVSSVDPQARYAMDVALLGNGRQQVWSVPPSANNVGELHINNWLGYFFDVPEDFPEGDYDLAVRVRNVQQDNAVLPLGYRDEYRLSDGFYRIGTIGVARELK